MGGKGGGIRNFKVSPIEKYKYMKLQYKTLENKADKLLGIRHKSKQKKKRKIKKQIPFYTKESKALYAEYMRKMKED